MNTKVVSQLDAFGYLLGPAVADESPLEPRLYLIPGGCVDVEPPEVPAGQRARWVAGEWIIEAAANPVDEAKPPESIEQWRDRMEVTSFQAYAALDADGLLTQVEALMANPATPQIARLAWSKAQVFRRMSPTVLTMGASMGLSAEAMDQLFIKAARIDA